MEIAHLKTGKGCINHLLLDKPLVAVLLGGKPELKVCNTLALHLLLHQVDRLGYSLDSLHQGAWKGKTFQELIQALAAFGHRKLCLQFGIISRELYILQGCQLPGNIQCDRAIQVAMQVNVWNVFHLSTSKTSIA